MQSYTQQVISAFARQGTPVDMVSIGNEIRNGILWPVGEINCTSCGGWDNLAQLLKAGVAGAQAGNPAGHKLLVMMHYDQGGNNALSSAFYTQLTSLGVPFDVIGLSYYPFFHGAISAMRANVDELATQFHKPIVIAETQYPWTLANGNSPIGDSTGNFVWQTSQLSPGYPASPGGQLSFVTDELSILAQVPDGLGAGLFYWAPDWIPGVPWEPGTGIGSPNVNLTLFNFEGAALPSIGIFGNPADVCERSAPGSSPCVVGWVGRQCSARRRHRRDGRRRAARRLVGMAAGKCRCLPLASRHELEWILVPSRTSSGPTATRRRSGTCGVRQSSSRCGSPGRTPCSEWCTAGSASSTRRRSTSPARDRCSRSGRPVQLRRPVRLRARRGAARFRRRGRG